MGSVDKCIARYMYLDTFLCIDKCNEALFESIVEKYLRYIFWVYRYSSLPLERSPFYRRFRFSENFVNDGFFSLLCLCIDLLL